MRARSVGAVLLAAALAGCTVAQEPRARSAPAPVTAPAPSANASAQAAAAGDIPGVVRKVEPSVVTIAHDQGTGSGVVWSKDGVVVTNAHVVGDVERVEVAFFDGRRADGRVRATDPDTDLAVVDVERGDLQPATFQETLPAVGELAVAMGSPLGFQNTITAGIISGLHREIPGSAEQGIRSLVDLIQTDAAISPGNSGGALVNGQGEVVGINVAYIPPEQGAVAIGFAIPGATAVDVVGQLLRNGRATHSYLGIQPDQVTRDVAAELGLDQARGVVVLEVVQGGPAAQAGLEPGDVITRMDDAPIETVEDLFG
ncbi:MAG TPA: trypsin-like peptidase domain-containing protein, partial [Actinomycetota bacterium]|nr:trypsin-like peptidase domain-containing protein [Actinomycetota bacterium]